MRKIATFVVDRAWWTIAVVLVITAVFATRLPRLEVKDTIEHFFLEGDPSVAFYHAFLEQFESDEFFLVAFKNDDVYSDESLKVIAALTERLTNVAHVRQVISLTNATTILGRGDGDIEVRRLIPSLPLSAEDRRRLPALVADNPLVVGSIVAPDGKAAAVFCRVERREDDSVFRKVMTDEVRRIMAEVIPPSWPAHAAGGPIFYTEYMRHVNQDLQRFVPVTVVVLSILMLLIYRRWRAVWLPMLCILAALVWTLGLLQWTGRSLNLVTNIIPPLVLVIGVAVIVHVMNRYEEEYRRLGDRRAALIEAVAHLIQPCFLTSLTTAVGFASVAVSRITPIRDTGLLAAFGVMATFAIAITAAPAILAKLAPPAPTTVKVGRHDAIDRTLAASVRFTRAHPRAITVVGFALTALGILGTMRLTVETNLIEYFHENSEIRQSYRFLEENISGANSLEFYITGPEADSIIEPEALRAMDRLQRHLEKSPRITSTQSAADLVKMLNRAFHDGDPAYFRIPDTRREIAQLLLVLSMGEDGGGLNMFTDLSYTHARVSSRMTTIPSNKLRALIADAENFARETFPAQYRVEATGEVVLYVDMEKELVEGQLKGFGFAIVVIIGCIMLFFWSVRVGLYSIYPNVMPILMTLGVMGVLRIPINLATCMLPSIAIGIAVDDTIHFLARVRKEYAAGGYTDLPGAVTFTLSTTGRAMVITSVVLFSGFMVLLLSQFQPNMYFGVLTALTMVWALAADLLSVPALLLLLRPKRF